MSWYFAFDVVRNAWVSELWASFRFTLLIEILVVGISVGARIVTRGEKLRWRPPLGQAWLDLKNRQQSDRSSSFWSIPVMTWALEASTGWSERLSWGGLVNPGLEYYYEYVASAALCLCLVAGVQTIACIMLGQEATTLGILGPTRLTVVCNVISVLLDFYLVLTVWRWHGA